MGGAPSIATKMTPLSVEEHGSLLQLKLAQLQQQLEVSKQQNAQLQQQLEVSKQQNAQLQQQLEVSKQQNAELQIQLERSKQRNAQLQEQLVSDKQQSDQPQQQLESCQKTVLFQQRLEDVACQTQITDVLHENGHQIMKACESEAKSEFLTFAAPPQPILVSGSSDDTFAKCSAGIVRGKNRRHEKYVFDIFSRHCQNDASGRFSGLAAHNLIPALLDADAPNIPASEEEAADLIRQFDANSNGVLDRLEFLQVVNEPDELQLWLSEKQVALAADALRPLVGRGSDQLQKLSNLSPADIDHASAATHAIIPGMLKELHQELQASFSVQLKIEAEMKADPNKFNDFYKMACGTINDFHKGLTGRVGMPHLNFKNAMRQEHCERAGFNKQFTTGNYKITTTPKMEWLYVVENEDCPDMAHNRRHIPISNLLQLKVSQDAELCEEEVIAIVLYTGPMFQIYNTILRRYPEDKFAIFRDGDNLFSTTIFVLVSAVQKLSRFTRVPLGTLLYRGLGGKMDLPDIFFQIDDQGCSGYAEWGFLSTSSDRDVALGYSGVKERRRKAMVMVIETTSIDRGADISEFSQYPGEKEFLYLPCSFVQRTRQGNSRVQVVDGGLVAFIPVKVNLNIKTQTVKELQEQKKSLHMVSARSMLAEVKFELTEFVQSCKQQGIDLERHVGDVSIWLDDGIDPCRRVVDKHEKMEAKDFADDEKFRLMINEILDKKAVAIGAKKWQQTRMQLHSHNFQRASCVAKLVGHSNYVEAVAFHPTAPLLASSSSDRTVKLWRLSSDHHPATCDATLAGHSQIVHSVAFHPTAPLLASGSADKTVKFWWLSPDNPVPTCVATLSEHTSYVRSVAFHPLGRLMATGSNDDTVKLWRLSPDNLSATCVATLEGRSDNLSAVRVATLGEEESEDDYYGHKGGVLSVVFHPTALVLATGSDDKTVKLWRLSSDDLSTEFFAPKRNMYTKCACVRTLKGHREYVTCVAFHPNEPVLATGSRDHTVKLWRLSSDYHSATSVATLEGFRVAHSDYVRSVAFHPTGHLFATGSDDKTVKLWRLSPDNLSATCVATLEGHSDYVTSVAFHPSAPRLATSSRDFTVKLWHYCFKSC